VNCSSKQGKHRKLWAPKKNTKNAKERTLVQRREKKLSQLTKHGRRSESRPLNEIKKELERSSSPKTTTFGYQLPKRRSMESNKVPPPKRKTKKMKKIERTDDLSSHLRLFDWHNLRKALDNVLNLTLGGNVRVDLDLQ
jgi:hypothetical protein